MAIKRVVTVEIEEETWNKWKTFVPRGITLSKAVADLIEDDLERILR